MAPQPANQFASTTSNNNNNPGEARYFGEYREPQGCFNACGSTITGSFQAHNLSATTTTLSQAKDELKQTEDFLASEFNKLSFQERAKALEDVHCVAPEESSALLLPSAQQQAPPPQASSSSLRDNWPRHPLHSNHLNFPNLEPLPPEEQDPIALRQLFDELERKIQKENNHLYNMASLQNPDYLADPKLRLMFLRANFYKVPASVKQLMSFLKYKAQYFGKETLGREITLEDMTAEEQRIMQSGLFHIQATRDKSGRVITPALNRTLGKIGVKPMVRIVYYMWFNIILRMPGAQTKGLTAVYYDNVQPGEEFVLPGIRFLMTLTAFSNALPLRQSSMHFCLKTTKNSSSEGAGSHLSLNNGVLALLTNGFPHYTRVRMKIHFGSDMELLYQLQSYGIDMNTFPVDVRTGQLKPDDVLNKWYYEYHNNNANLQQQQQQQQTLANDNVIMSDDIAHLDSVDLEKTLLESPLLMEDDDDEDGMMEARVLDRRGEGEGGNDNDNDDDMGGEALLNALGIDWNVQYDASLDNIDLMKEDNNSPTLPTEQQQQPQDNTQQVVAPTRASASTNMGWLQSVVMDALGFGSDGVTGDHALETPGPSVRDDGALSPVPTGTPTSSSSAADGVPNNNNNIPPLSLDNAAIVVEPSPEDILLGRGKNVQYHPGNVKFREWLEEYREEYERTPRSKKRRIATEMVQILSSNGIRFLKQCSTNKNSWVVVDSKEAEEKISQLFRSRRKKQQHQRE